jgi:hypothetical protein
MLGGGCGTWGVGAEQVARGADYHVLRHASGEALVPLEKHPRERRHSGARRRRCAATSMNVIKCHLGH